LQYYGNRISENISRREPEGYLLCLNVPVARTGMQEYLPEELGLGSGPGFIQVYRPEEEVFAPETMASFEAVPVTNDHPRDGVDLDNIRRLQAGHAQNVRRGSGEEADLLLADLVITDERLIEAILNGKREISCGYTYELAEENGRYIQRKIRGNHIAVVDAGRAGARVSIKDHMGSKGKAPGAPFPVQDNQTFERRKGFMKKGLGKILARMAKDGDVETVAEFIEEMIGESVEEAAAGTQGEGTGSGFTGENAATPVIVEAPEAKEVVIDEDTVAGIIERLDKLIALLSAAPAGDEEPEALAEAEEIAEIIEEVVEEVTEAAEGDGPEDADGDAAEEIAEIVEAILEPDVSTTLEEIAEEDEDTEEQEEICNDAVRAALRKAGPVLARMTRKERRQAAKDIAAEMKNGRRKGAYRGNDRASRRRPADPAELGKRIMAARNVNYKGRV
jgi:hypothetical protein